MSNWQSGKVIWFDVDKSEGEVRCEDGKHYYFHYSAIHSTDNFKKLVKDALVKFTTYENLYMKQIDKIFEV